jgi:hypothetical protein
LACALLLSFGNLCQASIQIQAGDYIRMNDGPGGNGGAFFANETNAGGIAVLGDTFATFCVETSQYISLPGTYYVAGVGMTNTTGGNLTPLAAWIYDGYLNNTLASFLGGISPSDIGSAKYNNTVQMAVWMQVIGHTEASAAAYISGDGYSSAWLGQLLTHNYGYAPTDFRGVKIMNLLSGPGGSAIQDQLVRETQSAAPEAAR